MPQLPPERADELLIELWPTPKKILDPAKENAKLSRLAPADRPWVVMVMITSIDGAAEVAGRSGALGNASDKAVFGSMRAIADIVLAGASTVRAENYGLVPPRNVEGRAARGQTPAARLAVLSHSLHFEPDSRLLAAASTEDSRPLVYTSTEPTTAQREALEATEIVVLPDSSPAAVLADVRSRGASVVVLEGGPSVNAQFLAADLVDEINVSLAPWATAGEAIRIAQGAVADPPLAFDLDRVWLGGDIVFTRHLRRR